MDDPFLPSRAREASSYTLLAICLFASGCYGNKCQTWQDYEADMVVGGTLTYGQPPVSATLTQGGPEGSAPACMQAPDRCSSLSFDIVPPGNGAPLYMLVAVESFKSGKAVSLPAADVAVTAWLVDGSFPNDAGAWREDLVLVGGTVMVAVALNDFSAQFGMTFTAPNGDTVTVQDGTITTRDAMWKEDESCQ